MNRRILFILIVLLFTAAGGFAQSILNSITVSKADFSSIAGTPRVVRNGFQHVWLVAWRQQGAPSKILGRIVQSNGALNSVVVLEGGVSVVAQSFDVAYDSVKYTYLLAFENSKGLQVQLFNGSLAKVGTPSVIEAGVVGTNPRLSFDPVGKHFLIFWFSTLDGLPALKSRVLSTAGAPLSAVQNLVKAASGKTFSFLNISRNQKNGNLIALVLVRTGSTSAALQGYKIKPNATLISTTPLVFQSSTTGLNTMADAAFTDAGAGFAFWIDKTAVKYRSISATFGLGAIKSIANAAGTFSVETGILFDSRNNQFIGNWTKGNQVFATVISTTGAILKQSFVAGTSALGGSAQPTNSYDPQLGNGIVAWDDFTSTSPTKFRERAAVFFVGGATSTSNISIGDNFYAPSTLTVPSGTTVKWTHNGNNNHTVTSNTGLFDSGTLNTGNTFSFRFNAAGTFNYFCQVHGAAVMSGTITVQDSGPEPPPGY